MIDIPRDELRKISKRIDKLTVNPFPPGHEKMKGAEDLYRVRQGDYRILYSVLKNKLIVLIIKIGHRREGYR